MTDSARGILLVAAGAVMISFGAVFVKLADVGPMVAGFYRMLFGTIFLLAILAYRRQWIRNARKILSGAIICGLLFALDLSLWHRCIYLMGPGVATLLANFQVFFFAAFGILILQERLDWRLAVSIPLAIVGLAMIVGFNVIEMTAGYRLGVLLGIGTAMSYATFMIVLRWLQQRTGTQVSYSTVTIITITSAVAMGAAGLIEMESFDIPNLRTLSALLAYGFAGQVLGWLVIARGLPYVRASSAGLILLLQPAMAFVWDVLFFNRPTTLVEVAGAALALSAIYLGTTSRAEARPSV